MIRKAEKKDLSRIAEILVFDKRMNYRSIFKTTTILFMCFKYWMLQKRVCAAGNPWIIFLCMTMEL